MAHTRTLRILLVLIQSVTLNLDTFRRIDLSLQERVKDLRFLIGQLREMNTDPLSGFNGIFDLERLGALGSSIGALTAQSAAELLPQIDAAIGYGVDQISDYRAFVLAAHPEWITADSVPFSAE